MTANSILHLAQMEAICQQVRDVLLHASCISCMAPNPRQLYLFFQAPASKILFLGFEKSFLRFHLLPFKSAPSSPEHHVLTTSLHNKQLEKVELLNGDRILALTFSESYTLLAEFFPRHPNYYLLHPANQIILSLYPRTQSTYTPPPKPSFSHSGPILTQEKLEEEYHQWRLETEKTSLLTEWQKELKKLEKKESHFRTELETCANWESIHHEAELLKANFHALKKGLSSLTVWDWLDNQNKTLILDPLLTPQEQMAKRFLQSKKRQKGIEPLSHQLQKIISKKERIIHILQQIKEANHLSFLIPFKRISSSSKPNKKPTSPLPYYEYISSSGLKIWVGKTARHNDILTFKLAKGSDWWLHIQDYPGSHVIIRTVKGKDPDEETLQDAMQLALYHSKARQQGAGEICITQRKFISRLGKEAGKVQISKHKKAFVRWNPHRYESLKDHQNE